VDELTALVGAGARVAVSANALDEVAAELVADMFWATGGNAFVLRKALQRSGVDQVLDARVRAGSLAYGGSSAGACVAGSTLRGLELIDDAVRRTRLRRLRDRSTCRLE
jgi:peptidase E